MKQYLNAALLLLLLLTGLVRTASGQVSLGTSLSYTQDFDAMGGAASAPLPTGWGMQASNAAAYGTVATYSAGLTGTGALAINPTVGAYNLGNGVAATATDRAIGFSMVASNANARSIMARFANNSGNAITSVTVSFVYEKFKRGNMTHKLLFRYSTDSLSWDSTATGNQEYSNDGTYTTINPPSSIRKTLTINGINIPNGSKLYLRWTDTILVADGTQIVGIDSFSLAATAPATCTPPVAVNTVSGSVAGVSSASLNWNYAAGSVLVVRRQGAAPQAVPTNGLLYTPGMALAAGDTVVYAGTAGTATTTGLQPGTSYYFALYSYNPTGFAGSPCYNVTNPALFDTVTQSCLPGQVSGVTLSSPLATEQQLDWILPATGASVLVLRRQGTTAVTDVPVQGTTYAVGSTIGASAVVFAGSGTSALFTALSTNTAYRYAIFAYDPTGLSGGACYMLPGVAAAGTTPVCNGAAQITGLSAPVVTAGTVNLAWAAPANNIIVFRRQGGTVAASVVNGTIYSVGGNIGTDSVIYIGSASGFADAGLKPGTNYYYKAFAFDPVGTTASTPCYNTTTAPALGPVTTLSCNTVQATAAAVSNRAATSLTLSWTLPAGLKAMVLYEGGIQVAIPSSAYPVTGTVYQAGDTTGFTTPANGNLPIRVAYTGTGNSITITGLTAATNYRFQVLAYDSTAYDGFPCYNITSMASVNTSTLVCDGGPQAAPVTTSNITYNDVTINWAVPANSVLILRGSTTPAPVNGVTYNVGAVISGDTVLYAGPAGGALTIGGINPGASYAFRAVGYDATAYNGTPCYNTTSIPSTTGTTTACAIGQPTGFAASAPTGSTANLSWTPAAGGNTIVLRAASTAVFSNFANMPVAGNSYTAGQTIGGSTVAYTGNGSTAIATGLAPTTTYYFVALNYTNTGYTGGTPCYNLQGYPVTSSATIACTNPTVAATALQLNYITASALHISWVKGNGTRHIVKVNDTNSFAAPVNGVETVADSNYSGGEQVVYNQDASDATVYGLTPGKLYYIAVYAANCNAANVRYLATALSSSNAVPLAIRLRSFTVTARGSVNELHWSSAAEEKGDSYTAERSADGRIFEPMAVIAAKGQPAAYTVTDQHPLAGSNHYRLRLGTASGQTSYSLVVTVSSTGDGFGIVLHPNPVTNLLHVQLRQPAGVATLQITDLQGRVLRSVVLQAGTTDIAVADLQPGCYLLRYSDATHTENIKMNKQ